MSTRGVHIEIQDLSHRYTAKPLIAADVACPAPDLSLVSAGLERCKDETDGETEVTAR